MSFNRWLYTYANPANLADPSGHDPWWCDFSADPEACWSAYLQALVRTANGPDTVLPPRCPEPPDPAPPTPPPSPDACPGPGCIYIGEYNLSAYYAPLEAEWPGEKIKVLATEYFEEHFGKYLGNQQSCQGTSTGLCYTNASSYALRAKDQFLYRSDGICEQGMGKVEDGRYISCTTDFGFEWKGEPGRFIAFETAASNPGNETLRGAAVYIPGLVATLEGQDLSHPNLDGWLTVTDVGEDLAMNTIDVYIGEGQAAYNRYYRIVRDIESTPVYRRP